MQAALDELWPYTRQLFQPINGEERLVASGYVPVSGQLQADWEVRVVTFLHECSLEVPLAPLLQLDREEHTAHLKVMLKEMQSVARLEREARW